MLADEIDALLPQTQCTKCGFQGCRPYALAIAAGQAEINRCPPGGDLGIEKLAKLLALPVVPLNPECGEHKPLQVAVIDEAHCIGCTLCIQACPVDAIIGASKRMHTVIAKDCTGCDLCIAPCPVDCISMHTVVPEKQWQPADADRARVRYYARQNRLAELPDTLRYDETSKGSSHPTQHQYKIAEERMLPLPSGPDKQSVIAAALARARARRAQP